MYTLDQLKNDKELWSGIELIPTVCSWCNVEFEVKYGTLYNVIRRDAEGLYCCRRCAGAARAHSTQEKYKKEGGKECKRCGEFKLLENFSSLPNPPFFRSECKRCHNYKPARSYSFYKERAIREGVPFKLNLDQFENFWSKDCYYCKGLVKKIRIELLDYSEGYVLQNMVSCCRQCQKFKGDLSHEDFIKLCHKISDNVRESEV